MAFCVFVVLYVWVCCCIAVRNITAIRNITQTLSHNPIICKLRAGGACPTRGGYKTENGQEVFLSDNEIFSDKFQPPKTPCPPGNPAPKSHKKHPKERNKRRAATPLLLVRRRVKSAVVSNSFNSRTRRGCDLFGLL